MNSPNILFVDDSVDDINLLRIAMHKSGRAHTFNYVLSAEDAIEYLRGRGAFADRARHPFPNVLFVDLKMPGMGGFGLLTWIRDHPECRIIPTIVFSASGMDSDVQQAYELGANAYIVKPMTLDNLVQVMDISCQFWSRCALPAVRECS